MIQHKWRLSATESGLELDYLYALGLPYPRNNYAAFSARVPQGDGGEAVHGYHHDTWVWDTLTAVQLQTLEGIVTTARASGLIYATLPRLSGDDATGWVDVSGKAGVLDVQKRQNSLHTLLVGPVSLSIRNITIINEPSEA